MLFDSKFPDNALNFIDSQFDNFIKITLALGTLPVPYGLDVQSSPYSIIPKLASSINSSLRHYEMDHGDGTLYSGDPNKTPSEFLKMRMWRIFNLIQILHLVIPKCEALYDPQSEIYSDKFCRYFDAKPTGWESFWDETNQTTKDVHKTAEIVARKMLSEYREEISEIYKQMKQVIGESTWDL